MSIFESLARRVSSFFAPSKPPETTQGHNQTARRKRPATTKRSVIDSDTIEVSRKRKRGQGPGKAGKRKKHAGEETQDPETYEQSGLSTPPPSNSSPDLVDTPASQANLDRTRMPPPPTPLKRSQEKLANSFRPRGSWDHLQDDTSEPSYMTSGTSHRRSGEGVSTDFDMEVARHEAEATTLPPNSGIWAEAEKDLFYHLSMRGFEPLLPNHWMVDFKTLPLSLYERPGTGLPLIQPLDEQNDFRAIHALRDLIDLGKTVRGRIHSSRSQITNIVHKAVQKYLDWALGDADLASPELLPVHSIVTLKKSKQTSELVDELLENFHTLASQQQTALDVHPSVENDVPTITLTGEATNQTLIVETSTTDPPTLYGFLILSSVVAILTFPPHAHPNKTRTTHNNTSTSSTVENTGLRTIGIFDFSKAGQDVWNALAIAIVVMEVRRTMLRHSRGTNHVLTTPVANAGERGRTQGGKVKGKTPEKRKEDEDDPDL